jgi:recombination directionality factor gp3-like protein
VVSELLERSMTESTLPVGLLSGLTYTVPIEGVIRLGYVVQSGDRWLPKKDDEFSITLKHKLATGEWAPHPIEAELREKHGVDVAVGTHRAEQKLRKIPVVIAFDNPALSISEQYAAFSREGRPLCVGNGKKCRRRDGAAGAVQEHDCPGADACAFGLANRCDAFVRLMVQIEGQENEGAYFILRSGSINAVTDCRNVLESSAKLFGCMAGMPMWLTLEAKSSSMSKGSIFWFASLRPREKDHLGTARRVTERRAAELAAGLDRKAYEEMLISLRGNGAFAEAGEDTEQIEDVVAARFVDSDADDGGPSVTVGVPAPSVIPGVAELTSRLVLQASDAARRAGDGGATAQAGEAVGADASWGADPSGFR